VVEAPATRLLTSSRFDIDDLTGEMTVTARLKKASVGTEVNIVQEGIADAIPPQRWWGGLSSRSEGDRGRTSISVMLVHVERRMRAVRATPSHACAAAFAGR
jgi:hypothetical protein